MMSRQATSLRAQRGNPCLLAAVRSLTFLLEGVSGTDAQLLSALGETLEGEASVVAAISGSGRDQVELSKNAKASGSILISEGSWKEIRIAEALFAPDALKKMEEAVGESFSEAAKQRLVSLTGEIRDAKISFESVGEAGELSEVSWSQGPIEFNANGKVEAGLLNLQGKAAVEKGLSAELVAAPASRKLLFDSEGKILLPITISGKVSSPEFSVDIGKLTAKLKERETAAPGPAASVEEKPKAPAKPAVSPKPKPHVRKKRAPGGEPERKPVLTPDKKRQRSSVPPTGEQVDDILKVIIGN